LPALSATTPSNMISVSFAEYSNGLVVFCVPRIASIQFISWLVLMRS
jgi:hypothetical protein